MILSLLTLALAAPCPADVTVCAAEATAALAAGDALTATLKGGIACEAGYLPACFVASEAATKVKSEEWAPACAAGEQVACGVVALMGPDRPDSAAIFEGYCDLGLATACRQAGSLAMDRRNVSLAVTLFEKACAGGSGISCSRLAEMFVVGIGVSRDRDRAQAFANAGCEPLRATGCRGDGLPPGSEVLARAIETGDLLITRHTEQAAVCLVAVQLDGEGRVTQALTPDCDSSLKAAATRNSDRWRFEVPEGEGPFYASMYLYTTGD